LSIVNGVRKKQNGQWGLHLNRNVPEGGLCWRKMVERLASVKQQKENIHRNGRI